MNYSISSYVGSEVRRFAFLIKRGDEFYNLFTLFEAVLPDMSDFDQFTLEDGQPFCQFDRKAPGNEDKIFLSVDIIFTEVMLTIPWDNMVIDGKSIKTDSDEYQWLVEDHSEFKNLTGKNKKVP